MARDEPRLAWTPPGFTPTRLAPQPARRGRFRNRPPMRPLPSLLPYAQAMVQDTLDGGKSKRYRYAARQRVECPISSVHPRPPSAAGTFTCPAQNATQFLPEIICCQAAYRALRAASDGAGRLSSEPSVTNALIEPGQELTASPNTRLCAERTMPTPFRNRTTSMAAPPSSSSSCPSSTSARSP